MKRLLRSNSKMFITICILSSFVIGLSYATFKVNSTSYKATTMMVSKLMYGISIQEINKNTSTINGNVVTIPANTKSYFYVTISSINKIDSKYSLAYKSNNNVIVKYSDKSEYTPTEEIEGFTTTNTYSKVVKISIDNTSNSTSTEVTINAFGGYTHNSYTSIILDSGYLSISNTYAEGQDINLISYTLNGSVTDISYDTLTSDYDVNTITCENGSTAVWDSTRNGVFFSTLNVPDYCTIDFKEKVKLPTLAEVILRDNLTISERTDFSVTNVANTTGTIYKTNKTEDDSIVYYYSGNTTNNWVYFGGFYWRIIRTNEDGSVRLLYAGTSHDLNDGYILSSIAYNSSDVQSRYVGYMYGGTSSLADNRNNTTSSTIKGVIDTWYQNNLLSNYDKYVSKSAIYCNDRSVSDGIWSNAGDTDFYFGAYTRLVTNKTPTYKCGGNTSGGLFESTKTTGDKFSVNATGGGNGKLTYGIALMTADEIVFAGGSPSSSLSSPYAYYYTNSGGGSITGSNMWWLMTPRDYSYYFNTSSRNTYIDSNVFVIGGNFGPTAVTYTTVTSTWVVRPVLSIDPCAKVTGTGTPEDPYVIDESASTC